tara:strand:- start:759 stop:1514 length:756 start_codon:yes stop_codon:yes gene_type:complete
MSYIKWLLVLLIISVLSLCNYSLAASAHHSNMVLIEIEKDLYFLGGTVGEGDCKRIVPLLPFRKNLTIILESPGGSLQEGMCFSEHLKRIGVTTVVQSTPIISDEGEILYNAGHYTLRSEKLAKSGGRRVVICASACSLMFLSGDIRKLKGDVYLGIHSPRAAAPYRSFAHAEASAFAIAAKLLKFLQHQLLVEDGDLRRLFITIPARDMYYVQHRHFKEYPWLRGIATHYYNFQGYTSHNPHSSPYYHRR